MMTQEAWQLFLKLSELIIKWLKNRGASFISCSLLLVNHLAKRFATKLQWYDRLIMITLSLLATWLMSIVIKTEAFKTI